jgi:hypothetical protein
MKYELSTDSDLNWMNFRFFLSLNFTKYNNIFKITKITEKKDQKQNGPFQKEKTKTKQIKIIKKCKNRNKYNSHELFIGPL